MISREQFEALVRAAAAAKYPLAHHDPANGPIDFSVNDRQRNLREAYIAARMEHEWPLVEALQGLVDDVSYVDPGVYELDLARIALSPYTTKPIER